MRALIGGLLVSVAILLAPAVAGAASANSGSFVLTATNTKTPYAPTFTGNGLLGVRVPPAGQGYAGGTVPALSELAGFYAKPDKAPKASERVQQRANIPSWSALKLFDGAKTFSAASASGWRQSIDLRTGIITTSGRWHGPDGHLTDIRYEVFTDRAREHVGVVRLRFTPRWSGPLAVTDTIDGTADRITSSKLPPVLTDQQTKGWDLPSRTDWLTIRAQGTGILASLASRLQTSRNITVPSAAVDKGLDQSVAQQLPLTVTAGQTYTLTKYVGVEDSNTTSDPLTSARNDAAAAASAGYSALRAENDAAWAKLWKGRIDVAGNRTVATDVNASQFYLWSSTRNDQPWSVSPAGLSSNGYDGHIFWDAETWMYPSLLAQHPDLAARMTDYRFDRLSAARRHANATGSSGARFPWESALDGTEQIPPPVSVNSEGLYEQHITADIALAQWQYFVTTGDTGWLRTRGWPVISGAARFWASRAVRGADGRYHIRHVTGPDEENPNVPDEAFTNAGARGTLLDAAAAARALGMRAPASWSRIARGLALPVKNGIHPEYAGYRDQLVKQADVTLLPYQWRFPMSTAVEQADLNFYVPRTDPGGPSMDDAVSAIDTAAMGTPGCATFVFTRRSYEPFIKDPFDQFSETKTGGAFTFMTGIGGFLQEFLYGYSGLRLDTGSVTIAPTIDGQLRGVTLHDLHWRGRTFTVAVGDRSTRVTVTGGRALPVSTPGGHRTVARGHSIMIATARPDLTHTSDAVRCAGASATTAEPGAPALAAVDGSPATDWQPVALPASVTSPLRRVRTIRRATIRWGRYWPVQITPNVHPASGPIQTLSATDFALQTSTDGRHWHTAIAVHGLRRVAVDQLSFAPVRARYVRLRMTKGNSTVIINKNNKAAHQIDPPMLQELTVG